MNDTDTNDCQCLCGAVRFTLPTPLAQLWMCHCSLCRRWAGGAPLNGGLSGTVTLTAGDSLRWYASSAWGERGFCAECGSSLFWRRKGAESGWIVCAGALPSADRLQLAGHIYIDDKPAYYDMAGDAPRLSGDQFIAGIIAKMPAWKRGFGKMFVFFLRLKNRLWSRPPSPGATTRGRCVCGSVRFSLPRAPQDAYMCHCKQCRRWSGGAGIIGVETRVEAIESGDTLCWHKTSARYERGFCGKCGASLFWRMVDSGDIREVCAGALEDDSGLRLREHIYIDDKPAYYQMTGDAERVSGEQYQQRNP